jgi:hypothetical protein
MPLTLSVNVSKKAGLPDYGSVGACCGIELELDAGLVDRDLDAFHGQVQRAYATCSQAVTDELARQTAPNSLDEQAVLKPSHNGNGSNGHRATDKQLDYALQLSRQIQGLGVRKLETMASKRSYFYRAPDAEDLKEIYAAIAVEIPCPAEDFWGRR